MKHTIFALVLLAVAGLAIASDTCYQESANTTNQSGTDGQCSLIYNGSYSTAGSGTGGWGLSGVSNETPLYDGDWSTSANHAYAGTREYLYINYTKPANATNDSLWMTKNAQPGDCMAADTTSWQILPACWSWSADQLRVRVDTYMDAGVSYTDLNYTCWNGSSWSQINYYPNLNCASFFYEEAMDWKIQHNVSACSNLTETNTTYTLNQSVSINGATCISINAANITLDCKGNGITGNNSSGTIGILSNQNGTVIKNCVVSNFSVGILLNNTINGSLDNISSSTTSSEDVSAMVPTCSQGAGSYAITSPALMLYGVQSVTATNITTSSKYGAGVSLYASSSNTFDRINSSSVSKNALELIYSSDSNAINNSNFSTTQGFGLQFVWCNPGGGGNTGNNFTDDSFSTVSGDGILIDRSNSNAFLRVNSTSGSGAGVSIPVFATDGTSFTDSTISSNSSYALSTGGQRGSATFDRTNLTSNYNVGFYDVGVASCSGVTFSNGVIKGNSSNGAVYSDNGCGSTISNSTIDGQGGAYAIYSVAAASPSFVNNTLVNATTLLRIDHSGGTFYWNNFTNSSGPYVNDTAGGNTYEVTNGYRKEGNAYFNVMNGSLTGINGTLPSLYNPSIYVGKPMYPYNNSSSAGKFICSFAGCGDNAPLTPILEPTGGYCDYLTSDRNMTGNLSASGTCFTFAAPDITLDCKGYTMTGSATGYGVWSGQNQSRIKNCNIDNFGRGIYLDEGTFQTNVDVRDSNITNSAINGIDADSTSGLEPLGNFTFDNLYINGTGSYGNGIYICVRENVTVTNSRIYSSGPPIYYGCWASGANVTGNYLEGTDDVAAYFYGGGITDLSSVIENNTFVGGASSWASVVFELANAVVRKNQMIYNGSSSSYYIVDIYDTTNTTFVNNTFSTSLASKNFIYIESTAANNTFYWNNFTSTSGYYVNDENGNNFYNSTLPGQNEGNIYANMNTSNLTGSSASTGFSHYIVANAGTSYPYNNSTSGGKMLGNVVDYAPLFYSSSSVPIMVSSRLSPTTAYTTSTLQGYCKATDLDFDNVTYNVTFYRNGLAYQTASLGPFAPGVERNVANMSGGLSVGANITLECLAYDSLYSSPAMNSSVLTISNAVFSPGSEVQTAAAADTPVEWNVAVTVSNGTGTCSYNISKITVQNSTVIKTAGGATVTNTGNHTNPVWACTAASSPYALTFFTELVNQTSYGVDYPLSGTEQTRFYFAMQYAQNISFAFNYAPSETYHLVVYKCQYDSNLACGYSAPWQVVSNVTVSNGLVSATFELTSNETVYIVSNDLVAGQIGGSGGSSGSTPEVPFEVAISCLPPLVLQGGVCTALNIQNALPEIRNEAGVNPLKNPVDYVYRMLESWIDVPGMVKIPAYFVVGILLLVAILFSALFVNKENAAVFSFTYFILLIGYGLLGASLGTEYWGTVASAILGGLG